MRSFLTKTDSAESKKKTFGSLLHYFYEKREREGVRLKGYLHHKNQGTQLPHQEKQKHTQLNIISLSHTFSHKHTHNSRMMSVTRVLSIIDLYTHI